METVGSAGRRNASDTSMSSTSRKGLSVHTASRGKIGAVVGGVLSAIVAAVVLVTWTTTGNAIPQSNPSHPTVACGGEWHWVHNQLPAGTTGGTLTVTFEDAGTIQVSGVLNPGGATVHYRLTLADGDTLVSASDDINGGRLLLSNFPKCETPSTSPSTPPPSTSEPPTTEPPTSEPPTSEPPSSGS